MLVKCFPVRKQLKLRSFKMSPLWTCLFDVFQRSLLPGTCFLNMVDICDITALSESTNCSYGSLYHLTR